MVFHLQTIGEQVPRLTNGLNMIWEQETRRQQSNIESITTKPLILTLKILPSKDQTITLIGQL